MLTSIKPFSELTGSRRHPLVFQIAMILKFNDVATALVDFQIFADLGLPQDMLDVTKCHENCIFSWLHLFEPFMMFSASLTMFLDDSERYDDGLESRCDCYNHRLKISSFKKI